MSNENENIEKVYYEVLTIMEKLLKDNYEPLAVAGVLMNQALSLYKAELSETGYNRIIESVVDKKDTVQPYEIRVLH
jgi:hypothetical protein